MEKQDVIPAGSQPLKDEETTVETPPEPEAAPEPEGKLLGKFESPEDMAAGYSELEKVLGRQSAELSQLRQQAEKQAPAPAQEQEPPQDFVGARGVIEKQIEEGELSISEGLTKLSALTQQETEFQLEEKFAAYDEKRAATEQYDNFVGANPDFLEYEQQGALNEEMAANPMHDKFSAYYAVKAKVDTASAYEKGKEEALKLAKGADGTKSVLSKPGVTAREPVKPQKGLSDSDKVSGMMAALAAARS